MNKQLINEELKKIKSSWLTEKTDAQLWAYEKMSKSLQDKHNGTQPERLRPYNSPSKRTCKLTHSMVKEIRSKYAPFLYGKQKLAREYGVSVSVVYRILKGKSWKNISSNQDNKTEN